MWTTLFGLGCLIPEWRVSINGKKTELWLALLTILVISDVFTVQIETQPDPTEMFPDVKEQVIEVGSTLTLTCVVKNSDVKQVRGEDEIVWTLPYFFNVKKNSTESTERVKTILHNNGTHTTSTMILDDAVPEDTGYYYCWHRSSVDDRDEAHQYVYVSSSTQLLILGSISDEDLVTEADVPITIPCKPTHPNVTVYLLRTPTDLERVIWLENLEAAVEVVFEATLSALNLTRIKSQRGFVKFEDLKRNDLLSEPDSRWAYEPDNGLTLKEPRESDTYYRYYCVGSMNDGNVNVNISNSYEKSKALGKFFLEEEMNSIDLKGFDVRVQGIKLNRVGEPDDPVEGSNVTFVCRTHKRYNLALLSPPTWSYQINGSEGMQPISETNPPQGFRVKTGRKIDDTKLFLRFTIFWSQLEVLNTTLLTPYTKFKCSVNKYFNREFREIPLRIKEINNNPVANIILIEKGIAENLTCNRLSEYVPIQWFKDGTEYTGTVHSNKTSSALHLGGIANEMGVYECRWNNSRGEARHRNFTVFGSFAAEEITATVISLSAIIVALLAIGIAISVKFYLHLEKRRTSKKSRQDPDRNAVLARFIQEMMKTSWNANVKSELTST